jgi:hypothetical protein
VALEFERGLNGVAYVRIVVYDQYAPAPNLSRIHQRRSSSASTPQ